jgi:predicted HicB family RNase H-like nuclease
MAIRDRLDEHHTLNAGLHSYDNPQVVITVRIGKALHERIREVAHRERTSMNVLCALAIEQAVKELED